MTYLQNGSTDFAEINSEWTESRATASKMIRLIDGKKLTTLLISIMRSKICK